MSTLSNLVNAWRSAGKLVLSGTQDPSSVATDAPRGTLFLKTSATATAFIKTDDGLTTNWTDLGAGGGGGGGGTIQVLSSDPVSPAVDEQWFLKQAPNEPTFVTFTIFNGMNAAVDISLPTPSLADLAALWPNETNVQNLAFQVDAPPPGLPVSITTPGAPIVITYDTTVHTVQNIVDALNTYSQGLVGKNWASVNAGTTGGTLFNTAIGGSTGLTNPASTDATNEAMTLKIQGTSKIFTRTLI